MAKCWKDAQAQEAQKSQAQRERSWVRGGPALSPQSRRPANVPRGKRGPVPVSLRLWKSRERIVDADKVAIRK